MSVFRVRYPAVVVALAAAVGVSATWLDRLAQARPKARRNGGSSGVTTARRGIRPRIKSLPATSKIFAWCGAGRRGTGPRPATAMQVSPLIVDGVMLTAGVNRDVVALDAATGQLLWHWRPTGELTRWFDIIEPVPKLRPRRHVLDGWLGDERIFVVMNSYMLVALDAKTGRQVASFGKNGVVDLGGEPAVERAARIAS